MASQQDIKSDSLKATSCLQGQVHWQSPANIALIKYWGKKPHQLPCNPSLSLTLTRSATQMQVVYRPLKAGEPKVDFQFEGHAQTHFSERIEKFLLASTTIFPFLKQLKLHISTTNTFPHSAGIASSAASMSALALCLCSIDQTINRVEKHDHAFYQKASYVARLASGSACRSVYGGFVTWGALPVLPATTDTHASPFTKTVHPSFQNLCNAILVVDKGVKKISSSQGHTLMQKHPFKSARFAAAKNHIQQLMHAISAGDTALFIKIVEQEALMLHAMTMSSDPYFILLRPNSLHIIEHIMAFRKKT